MSIALKLFSGLVLSFIFDIIINIAWHPTSFCLLLCVKATVKWQLERELSIKSLLLLGHFTIHCDPLLGVGTVKGNEDLLSWCVMLMFSSHIDRSHHFHLEKGQCLCCLYSTSSDVWLFRNMCSKGMWQDLKPSAFWDMKAWWVL